LEHLERSLDISCKQDGGVQVVGERKRNVKNFRRTEKGVPGSDKHPMAQGN